MGKVVMNAQSFTLLKLSRVFTQVVSMACTRVEKSTKQDSLLYLRHGSNKDGERLQILWSSSYWPGLCKAHALANP
jgi:hypothetical protein